MAGLLLVEEAGGYAAPFPGPGGLAVKAPVVATAPGIAPRWRPSSPPRLHETSCVKPWLC
jgi:hypothetical protein